MKAAALSVWIFINLLCFGMCGYLYLIWSQYWIHIERQRIFNRNPSMPQRSTTGLKYQEMFGSIRIDNIVAIQNNTKTLDYSRNKSRRSALSAFLNSNKITQSSTKSSDIQARLQNNVVRKSNGSPRFPNVHNPLLEFDNEKYLCYDLYTSECEELTKEFKNLLLKEFHRVLMAESKVFKSGLQSQNSYKVRYENENRKELTRLDALCALKNIDLQTITERDEPFKSLRFKIPRMQFTTRHFNTCAVVTSAGALLGSRLGEFIDSHEMVLRFNNAPTVNYTDDVGTTTTIRILNSQVMSKPEFNFLEDPLFRNISILVWDPANYASTLEEWYQHPDFPLFPVYKKLLAREKKTPDVHLLNPKVLWDLWTVLQDSSLYRLKKNPPSSGFIGIWLSLHLCRRVRVFEYVPSARATRRCHYHSSHEDAACTLGAWHPLAQEKALAERIRDNNDIDVFQRGFIDIPGFSNINCQAR